MKYRHNIVLSSEGNSTVVLTDAELNTITVSEDHPNFTRILNALQTGGDVAEWLNPNPASAIVNLSDRITVVDGVLHFDGEATYNGLADTIMRYRREDRDVGNLVRFMERLSKNPSLRSREQLFTWCQGRDLTIDTDGFIIGFKGVSSDMLSINAGSAIVDGTEVEGRIPNTLGAVIEMPRSMVQDDPNKGCSTGLHVGSWAYASHWGDLVLEVRIDPADVVSVPNDSSYQKLRCCRYVPIAIHETDDDDLDGYEPEANWYDDEYLDGDEGFDSFMEYAPSSFLDRLRDRLRRRPSGESLC